MLLEFILFLFAGALAGSLAGLLGIGGGIVVVPLLVMLFHTFGHIPYNITMQMAAGTSLCAMIFTSIASIRSHHGRGNVDWTVLKKLLPGIVFGVIAGVLLSTLWLNTEILQIILGAVLGVLSLYMFFIKQAKPTRTLPKAFAVSIIAFFVGLKSGLLGLGGGALIIPFLVYCNVPIRKASGCSSACTFPVAVVGAISFAVMGKVDHVSVHFSTGYIYWPAFFGIIIGSVLCVPLGATVAERINTFWLKRIFALFLFLVAMKMLLS